MATLYHMPYSPWSERARWALEHHRFPHTRKVFVPMISEPGLRLKLKRATGRFTLPILFDGAAVIEDSYDIARHADVHGSGAPLFPRGLESEIAAWNQRTEAALEAGRALVTRAVADDPAAKREALPPGMPGFMAPMADLGVRYFARKYGVDQRDPEADRAVVRDTLQALREALGGRDTLFDQLTYADVLAAVVLHYVEPVSAEYIKLGPASRAAWRNPTLIDEFADLVAWRDRLYAAHRKS